MRTLFFTTFLLLIGFSAHAAVISVSPHEIPLTGTSTVAISIDTEGASINALEMTLSFPESDAHIEGVYEGTSFVSFWTGAPTIKNNAVTFSGIIPGGFQGKGVVTTLLVSGVSEGETNLRAENISVLLNDGKGTSVPVRLSDMTIKITSGAQTASQAEDTAAPEPFTVSVISDPSIADGAYVAIFATQDKQTGIATYEVQETHAFSPNSSAWVVATSPYTLSDQTLKSRIFVRATDYEGNSRVEKYKGEAGISMLEGALYLMLSLVAVLLLFAFYVRHTHRKKLVFRINRCITTLAITALALFASVLFIPTANAATLSLNPSIGSYTVGSTIALDVLVDTEGKTINAVSGTLTYPSTSLRPTSIRTTDSVVTLWIQQPSLSKTNGSITFEGLILNPGFSGKGKIATINFEVIGPGGSTVSFSSGLTLANDGFGTNILSQLSPATFQFTGAAGEKIAKGEIEQLPFDPNELVMGALRPPVVTNYTSRPKTIKDFFVQGVTYPNAEVHLWVKHPTGDPEEIVLATDGAGNFSYRYGSTANVLPLLQAAALDSLSGSLRGIPYRFWLAAVVDGSETPPTQAFEMTVGGIGIPEMLLMIIILLILGVVALLIFEMFLLRRVYEHDDGSHTHHEDTNGNTTPPIQSPN